MISKVMTEGKAYYISFNPQLDNLRYEYIHTYKADQISVIEQYVKSSKLLHHEFFVIVFKDT